MSTCLALGLGDGWGTPSWPAWLPDTPLRGAGGDPAMAPRVPSLPPSPIGLPSEGTSSTTTHTYDITSSMPRKEIADHHHHYDEVSVAVPLAVHVVALDEEAGFKLSIPSTALFTTKAVSTGERSFPKICRLYQRGQCRRGEGCLQVHVSSTVLRDLRNACAARPVCCAAHGDGNLEVRPISSTGEFPQGSRFQLGGTILNRRHVAYTFGLRLSYDFQRKLLCDFNQPEEDNEKQPAEGQPDHGGAGSLSNNDIGRSAGLRNRAMAETASSKSVPLIASIRMSNLCKNHLAGGCAFAEDCNFIHVCRRLRAAIEWTSTMEVDRGVPDAGGTGGAPTGGKRGALNVHGAGSGQEGDGQVWTARQSPAFTTSRQYLTASMSPQQQRAAYVPPQQQQPAFAPQQQQAAYVPQHHQQQQINAFLQQQEFVAQQQTSEPRQHSLGTLLLPCLHSMHSNGNSIQPSCPSDHNVATSAPSSTGVPGISSLIVAEPFMYLYAPQPQPPPQMGPSTFQAQVAYVPSCHWGYVSG